MSRISLTMHFYLQGELLVTGIGYIPASQAKKIPQLQTLIANKPKVQVLPPKSQKKSESINQEEEEMDQEENQNDVDVDNQQAAIEQPQQMEIQEVDEILGSENLNDDQQDSDISMSDSPSISTLKNKYQTKRTKGGYDDFMELPLKKQRKKKDNETDDVVKKQQKQQKRKQYLKKQLEAQQKATLDKILNEAGRKLRLRQQQEKKDFIKRENRTFKTFGNVPKVIEVINSSGKIVMLHNTKLFNTETRDIKMKQLCTSCRQNVGKYKIKNSNSYACSLDCYKKLVPKQ